MTKLISYICAIAFSFVIMGLSMKSEIIVNCGVVCGSLTCVGCILVTGIRIINELNTPFDLDKFGSRI